MADLSLLRPKSSNRAQLLLVGAFALAVTFVALALVVNSAIYTENLATRGTVPGSGEALEQRHEVEQSVGTVLEYANWHNHTDLESSVQGSIENLSHDQNRQEILVNRAVEVNYVGKEDGHRIVQQNDSNRAFTNNTGFSNWVVAKDIDRARAFTIDITDPSELVTGSNAFKVVLRDGGDTWNMSVKGDANDMTITVENGATETCDRSITASNATIDVTGGLIAGQPCAALTKLTDTGANMSLGSGLSGSYDIEFENAQNIAGNYSLIIGSTNANGGSLASSPTSNGPFYTIALYSVTVEYAYQTHAVVYKTEIEVAPGEPR